MVNFIIEPPQMEAPKALERIVKFFDYLGILSKTWSQLSFADLRISLYNVIKLEYEILHHTFKMEEWFKRGCR